MSKNMQLTFAMLKPSTVKNPYALQEIQNIITENNFVIVKKRIAKFSKEDAERFYEEHAGKFYYNRLVHYMSR